MINLLKVLLIVAISNIIVSDLSAQAKISIQGTLKDAKGAAVADGDQSVIFKLFESATGGAEKWTETATVKVVGGIYSHYLGSITPLNAAIFKQTLFLSVNVGNLQLDPRIEMTYSPYSFAVQEVVCSGAVGDVKYSILNPTQFASVNGECWVPMDGVKTLAGTRLGSILTSMTNVPQGGGMFIRAQEFSNSPDHDPDRNSNTGIAAFQDQGYLNHGHAFSASFSGSTSTGGAHTHGFNNGTNEGGETDSGEDERYQRPNNTTSQTSSAGDHSHSFSGSVSGNTSSSGNNETRPKNLNFWVYIRVN